MIHFRCPRCGVRLKGRARSAGHKRTCPSCGGKLEVPASSGAPAPEVWNPDGAGSARVPSVIKPMDSTRNESGGSSLVMPTASESLLEDCSFLGEPQAPGDIASLGPFRIQQVLGAGATGIVFRAEDTQLRRPVALKVLRPEIAASVHSRRRFLREARAAAALDHEHILTIYQVGEDRGIPWMAMKLLRGETLKDRLSGPNPRLPADLVVRIGAEVADALAAAHSGGLVHRDVKPSNILLEESTDRAKLIDFGLVMVDDDEGSQLTRNGCVVGTPAYMAPEQADGGAVDHRSDLYGLGCVLYRSSTGRVPFEGQNSMQVFFAQRTQSPPHPRAIDPTLPEGLANLVMNLLARDPADRPNSAEAVRDALRSLRTESCTDTKELPTIVVEPVKRASAHPGSSPAPVNPWADVVVDTAETLVSSEGPSRVLSLRRREQRLRWLWVSVVTSLALLTLLIWLAMRH
jgi:serine/threonine protein kinase